jgi:hypothetical protein
MHDACETRCREPKEAATLGCAQFAGVDTVDAAAEVIDHTMTIPDAAPVTGQSA